MGLLGPLNLALVLAMAGFYRDPAPAVRRSWLLALPASLLLVYAPVLAIQATGNSAWLPDFSGLCCFLAALACLAHIPGPGPAGPPGRACGH